MRSIEKKVAQNGGTINTMFEHDIEYMIGQAVKFNNSGQIKEAEALCHRVLESQPNHVEALYLYGVIAGRNENTELALNLLEKAINLNPNHIKALNSLGTIYKNMGKREQAIKLYRSAINFSPEFADPHYNLAVIYSEEGLGQEAINEFNLAVKYGPDFAARAFNHLGILLKQYGQLDGAISASKVAIKLDPNSAVAYNNLGNLLLDYGDIDQAIEVYNKALLIDSNFIEAHSNLIFAVHSHFDYDSKAILSECKNWSKKFESPLLCEKNNLTHEKLPDKKLKIGFVSQALYEGAANRFLLPLFINHNNHEYDIFCYSSYNINDSATSELQKYIYKYRNIQALTDRDAANLIKEDQIDILVDLSLHTGHNRLLIFAHKPAPVQMTWLGYPSTTGMSSIDYRITDRYLDPQKEDEQFYSEKSIYISSYWCYSEPKFDKQLDVNELPAQKSEFVTFGCLNKFCKISKETAQCWIQLLKEISGSKLLINSDVGEHRNNFVNKFTDNGIDPSRIQFIGKQSYLKYFQEYNNIDIGLDPFPWNGGTTTCDALWMGVPVISLRGNTAVGRGGASILSNAGLFDFIANSRQEYIDTAKKICSDLNLLASIRAGLREKMRQSVLMNGNKFASEMEQIFRKAWMDYCYSNSM
ncbi:MAG: tetratricopeptide repeat protein [Holophagales bacterium]|jgi:predicted O-linked N-acetylglucosamine transferase (SPINDLY family)|nr:tetratricopeptide repeat protein [Holophagales bacterium]